MKTPKQIKEWLSPKSMYDSDLNRIVGYLEGQGYDLDNIFPLNKKVKQEPMSSLVYDKFKEWIESDDVDKTKFLSFGDISDAMTILLHTFDEDWEETATSETKVNKPKFKRGQKVQLKGQETIYTVKAIHRKANGGYRYDLVGGDYYCRFVRESKVEEYVRPIPKVEKPPLGRDIPKFKVGDWVRIIDGCGSSSGVCFQIKGFCDSDGDIIAKTKELSPLDGISISLLELYEPKEGEFYWVEANLSGVYIVCKPYAFYIGEHVQSLCSVGGYNDKLYTRHPATPDEKVKLIKAVEDKYNKTFNEETKTWEDVKPKTPFEVMCDNLGHGNSVLSTVEFQNYVTDVSYSSDRENGFMVTICFAGGTTINTKDTSIISWCSPMVKEDDPKAKG